MPALPLEEAGKYVAGAYVVFVVLLLVYLAIMAAKVQRIARELGELADLAERQSERETGGRAAEPVATSGSQPDGSGRDAEHSGGGIRSDG